MMYILQSQKFVGLSCSRFAFSTLLHVFLYFISAFILLTRKKAMEALIHRVAITPTGFWKWQDIAVRLKFNRDMIEI